MLSNREKKLMLIAFEYGFGFEDIHKPKLADDREVFNSWLDESVDSQGGTVEMLLDFDNKD